MAEIDGPDVDRIPLMLVDLRHLLAMTDDTGILQHARFGVADRNHGYCTDDNARALIVACRCSHLGVDTVPLDPLVSRYLAFLHYAFDPATQRFRNFMSYDRRWLEEVGSDDSHARALQALGVAVGSAPLQSQRDLATRLFTEALPPTAEFPHIRSRAFAAVGLTHYLRCNPADDFARAVLAGLCAGLLDSLSANATDDWYWFEPTLTYANARIPHALIAGGSILGDSRMGDEGRRALRWLDEVMNAPEGHLSVIGCNGWYSRGGPRARFDQQAIDAMSTLEAVADVYDLTGDEYWMRSAERAYRWFLGDNDGGVSLLDPATGGCYDGLGQTGVNLNMGAESTLAWLMALTRMYALRRVVVDSEVGEAGE